VEQDGKHLAIYGANDAKDVECEQVLLTHHRRDVVWRARSAIAAGAVAVAPEAERELIVMERRLEAIREPDSVRVLTIHRRFDNDAHSARWVCNASVGILHRLPGDNLCAHRVNQVRTVVNSLTHE
ncbi:MAG: hypothetical protein O3C40_34335, partial [Planctomycetota bacterium]|nr:hypothetical protein [Planctomycetota bacterium]